MTDASSHGSTEAPSGYVRVLDEAGPDDGASVVRVVTIDRPGARNAIDVTMMRELIEIFEGCASSAESTPGPRVVILTGGGDKAFVAGADIEALAKMSADDARRFSRLGHRLGESIESLPIPVIAAVNGYALGGGCEVALACDFIYASDTAKFGQPEAKLGAIPGFGGTQRLMRRVGIARAREILFTGEPIDAAEALRIGLCNRVFEPARLMPETRRVALGIAARAPLAIANIKRALRRGADRPLDEALEIESDLFAELFSTADLSRGMAAFLAKEKQPPKWQAR
jgi:enoyl-CoA hydratase